MSLADHIFIDMCNDILTNGTSTEGEKVRPHWPDGTPAYTIKKFPLSRIGKSRMVTASQNPLDSISGFSLYSALTDSSR